MLSTRRRKLVLALIFIVSCGFYLYNQYSSKKSAALSEASASVPVTIKFHEYLTDEIGRWDKVIAAFEQKYPDIRVEVVPLIEHSFDSIEAMKQLDFLAASGKEMDVLLINSPEHYAKRAAIGLLEPLDRFITEEGFNYASEYKVDTSVDGVYYALPARYDEWLTVLNMGHLEEAELPVPHNWTWDEYWDYAKTLTIGKGVYRRYGSFLRSGHFFGLMLWNEPVGRLLKPDGSSNLDHPSVTASLLMRNQAEAVERSSTPYSYSLSQKIEPRPQYFNQAASMVITESSFALEAGGTALYPASFKTGFAPFPKNTEQSERFVPVSADFIGISSRSKHKKEAYQFIRWYTTEGIVLQSSFIPSWRKPPIEEVVDNIIRSARHPELIDRSSLLNVLTSSKPRTLYMPRPYLLDVEEAFNEEAELYMLRQQDLETTMVKAKQRVDNIIRANQ
jgi:multiple sugar transport system substrate-binding protein